MKDKSDTDSSIMEESGGAVNVAGVVKPIVGRLTDDRIRRLEELGFVWSLRDDWMKHYEELKLYREQFGNWCVAKKSFPSSF
jgi:hypothetical protein